MVIHKQQGCTSEKNKVLETKTNFFKNNAKLMFLFFVAQVWVSMLPYLYSQLVWLDFGVGCGGLLPFINSITVIFVIVPIFNVLYILYLYLRKEINLITALIASILSSGITFITALFIVIPMC